MKRILASIIFLCVFATPALATQSNVPSTQQQIENIQKSLEHKLELHQIKIDNRLEGIAKDWQSSKDNLNLQQALIENGKWSVQNWLVVVASIFTILSISVPFLAWQFKHRIENEWKEARNTLQQELKRTVDTASEVIARLTKREIEADTVLRRLQEMEGKGKEHLEAIKLLDTKTAFSRAGGNEATSEKLFTINPAAEPLEKLGAIANAAVKEERWKDAVHYWHSLAQLVPDNADVWFNLAYCLGFAHPLKERSTAEFEDIQKALTRSNDLLIREGISDIFSELGDLFYDWADIGSTLQEKQEKTRKAEEFYRQADARTPELATKLVGAGTLLVIFAKSLPNPQEQGQKFANAIRCYRQATRLKPGFTEAFDKWGAALLDWAQRTEDNAQEKAEKYRQAEELLNTALHLEPTKIYNMARLKAIQGKTDEARSLLEEAKRQGTLPTTKHLQEDQEMQSLKDFDWFKALLETPSQ